MAEELLARRIASALPGERDGLLAELVARAPVEAGRVVVDALTADPRSWVSDAVGERAPRVLLQALNISGGGGLVGYWLAIAVARHCGEPGMSSLIDRLDLEDAEARELALLALNHVGRAPVDSLRSMLSDPSPGVRHAAVAGIGIVGETPDLRLLFPLFSVDDEEVVATVAAASRQICERGQVRPADHEQLADVASRLLLAGSSAVRSEALLLLGTLGRSSMIVEHLETATDTYERHAALLALGEIGDEIARTALEAQVLDPTASHRSNATADTLGEVAISELERLRH